MGQKSLTYYEARDIAKKMAEVAFRHLRKPLEDRLAELGVQAYKRLILKLPVELLIETEIMEYNTSCELTVRSPQGGSINVSLPEVDSNPELYATSVWNNAVTVVDHDAFFEMYPVYTQLAQLEGKQQELHDEIVQQIKGRSITAICRQWPEARPIVRAAFDLDTKVEMDVPLDNLLKKYLPALENKGE